MVRLLPLSATVCMGVVCAGLTFLSGCDALLSALCDPEVETCQDPNLGQIQGTITVPESSTASVGASTGRGRTLSAQEAAMKRMLIDATRGERARARDNGAIVASKRQKPVPGHGADVVVRKVVEQKFRPGEVIVRGHEALRGRKAEISRALMMHLQDKVIVDVRLCGTEFRCLADLRWPSGKPLDLDDTAAVAADLAKSPLLKYAEKNLILQKASVFPDDEFFPFQWHYQAIQLQDAWDLTQGDDNIVGAIIDTGILVDHEDLDERVIGGADLIDDAATANDGDGRDDDGDDAGDQSCGGDCHSHHGSHVAGTMGAETNNGTMVSGITWNGGLLAVRTLGVGGGSLNDIADGIEWSIGTDVEGVSQNNNPADVINMSLGGQGNSEVMNEAVANAVNAGAIVLVAAGNDDQDAESFTPANAPDAIAVAAVGSSVNGFKKASYSNFGSIVDIAAPGGEQAEDADSDGNGDGVLSTVGDFVAFYQGTSMATPHVAGVAMLMKSVNPELDQDEVRALLQDTSDRELDCDEGCGTGVMNAYGAVSAALNGEAEGLGQGSARVGRGITEAVVTFNNFDGSEVDVELSVGGANRDQVTLDRTSATIPANGKVKITATIERSGDDVGSATISAVSANDSAEARVEWTADEGLAVETVTVGAFLIREDGEIDPPEQFSKVTALDGFKYTLFNLDPGTYRVVGLLDAAGDDEDSFGFFNGRTADDQVCADLVGCGHVVVGAGDVFENADFVLAPGFSGGDDVGGGGDGVLGAACGADADCGGGLYCEGAFAGGYCTTDCNGGSDECPANSTCFTIGVDDEEYDICFLDCQDASDCGRAGAVCDADGSCVPA